MADGTVLVVDDDEATRVLLTRILKTHRYDVRTASTMQDAQAEIAGEIPDLVLLDIRLPDGDGRALCHHLRASSDTADLPVILMTAHHDNGKLWLATDADALVHKPLRHEELLTWVRSLVRARQAEITMDRMETMLVSIAASVEARSAHRADHLWRLARYSQQLAQSMGLDERRIRAVRKAALLHDIGMIGVPDTILQQPRSLTPAEFEQIKPHAAAGAELCRALADGDEISAIVRSHHERWHGGGYPDGIAGERIPVGARILAVVDAFDAMTTERPYQAALSVEGAIDALWLGGGAQWDPNVVGKFAAIVRSERGIDADGTRGDDASGESEEPQDPMSHDPFGAFLKYLAMTGDRP